jgi:hypothetical protein
VGLVTPDGAEALHAQPFEGWAWTGLDRRAYSCL